MLSAVAFGRGLRLPLQDAAAFVEKLAADEAALQMLEERGYRGLKQQLFSRAPARPTADAPLPCPAVPQTVGTLALPGPQPGMAPQVIQPVQLPAPQQPTPQQPTPQQPTPQQPAPQPAPQPDPQAAPQPAPQAATQQQVAQPRKRKKRTTETPQEWAEYRKQQRAAYNARPERKAAEKARVRAARAKTRNTEAVEALAGM